MKICAGATVLMLKLMTTERQDFENGEAVAKAALALVLGQQALVAEPLHDRHHSVVVQLTVCAQPFHDIGNGHVALPRVFAGPSTIRPPRITRSCMSSLLR